MGIAGTFVIEWSQTEIDGIKGAALGAVMGGSSWRWDGDALRVDGPNSVLPLVDALGEDALRRRAAPKAQRILGDEVIKRPDADLPATASGCHIIITDGLRSHTIQVIRSRSSGRLLLQMNGTLPIPGHDYWVIQHDLERITRPDGELEQGGVICFTAGTMIATPSGPRPVQNLRPGDLVLTRDNGPQEILWRGARRISGARMFVLPELRPVRILAHAFGEDRPDGTLLVSPEHRLLVSGSAALNLFNTDEVLVQARFLLNDRTITRAADLHEVTYIHLLLPAHEILWANGIECESFHPATASFGALDQNDAKTLEELVPGISARPENYGPFARRNLSPSEAAILSYDSV
ncbi:Hint domain-containing protein [Donghicola tyrosinivorans]|uniref:Hint domain-containing protein n=1 Tax=Donghicola tyrosinivorans TaxID=1652492 RepID=A0A2T0X0D8_9RHOB|nr:Hint domain-containing protein [Donghicola tyrosinivorans]PRY92400.1 Hint domain-containing protein [Donghicola tyrosinivorans]